MEEVREVGPGTGRPGLGISGAGAKSPPTPVTQQHQVRNAGTQGREQMPGRGRDRESWGILAEPQASRSLEQFLGKMKSSWRRGSCVTSNILSKLLPRGEGMGLGAGREGGCQRGKERVIRGFPPGGCRQMLPHRREKRILEFQGHGTTEFSSQAQKPRISKVSRATPSQSIRLLCRVPDRGLSAPGHPLLPLAPRMESLLPPG